MCRHEYVVMVHNIGHPGLPTSSHEILFETGSYGRFSVPSKSLNTRRIPHLHCGILQLIWKTIPSDERYTLDSRKSQNGRYFYFNRRNKTRRLFWWYIPCYCRHIYTLFMGKTTINPYATGHRRNRTRVNYTAKRNSYGRRVSASHGLQFIFHVAGLSGEVSHLFLLDRFSPDPEDLNSIDYMGSK